MSYAKNVMKNLRQSPLTQNIVQPVKINSLSLNVNNAEKYPRSHEQVQEYFTAKSVAMTDCITPDQSSTLSKQEKQRSLME